MDRTYYLNLAAAGLKMPIGADLVLREKPDHEAILLDARRLGQVVEETARRFHTPLALPLMDLALEKDTLLALLDVPAADIPKYHFNAAPDAATLRKLDERVAGPLPKRMRANIDAVGYIASQTDLLPLGMCIGPFSLMTKLIADPIVPVYMAGTGATAAEDPDVALVEACLEMGMKVILRSISEQLKVGAKAVLIAEPAANQIYISPKQMGGENDVFERYVMTSHRRIGRLLAEHNADLLFHCCGEITDDMLRGFASLDPAILSLGSSRTLWKDAAIVPKTTVLFGNVPSKKFFMDSEVTVEQVRQMGCELLRKMREVGHPFILGSECDVLSVPGYEETLRRKVDALMSCTID
jgi:uroporphyrinogen-III decarboxylase